MTFCWKCKICGYETETTGRHPPICQHGDAKAYEENRADYMIRDYRAENSNVWTFTNALGDGKVEKKTEAGGD